MNVIKFIKYKISLFIKYIKELINIILLRIKGRKPFINNNNSNIIVSLTSFPARINQAWISIETIFQQNYKPNKVVLVLSEIEFPNKKLPKKIQQQIHRGLEIIWTNDNIRSYKKLIPTIKRYPHATIITIDDDIFYEPWRLEDLVDFSKQYPGCIIGHRGWEISTTSEEGLRPYEDWKRADLYTNNDNVFLTSGAGTLIPPNVLDREILLDKKLAIKLCPNADDIWLWAVSRLSNVPTYCLGNHDLRNISTLSTTPNLKADNLYNGLNDIQIQNVIDYFGKDEIFKNK